MSKEISVGILLMGPMRAGKTTTAGFFREKYGIEKYALADKLKRLHNEVTGSYEKDRDWLQKNGEAHRTVFGQDFWANELVKTLESSGHRSFSVDDVRYKNEFMRLYEYGCKSSDLVYPLFIKVSLENIISRGGETELLSHESEIFARNLQNNIYQDEHGEFVMINGVRVKVLDGNLPIKDFLNLVRRETSELDPVLKKIQHEVDTYRVQPYEF